MPADFLFNMYKDTIYRQAITQRLNFAEQLRNGIRYFDLRICWLEGRMRFVHGMYGDDVLPALEVILIYLAVHRGEVLIIDFQHVYGADDLLVGQALRAIRLLFGDYLLLYGEIPLESLTPAAMLRRGRRVIVFWQNVDAVEGAAVWPRYHVNSPYLRSPRAYDVVSFVDERAPSNGSANLFVAQLISTPANAFDVYNGVYASLEELANRARPELMAFVATSQKRFNVVIRDFVDSHFSQLVLRRNQY